MIHTCFSAASSGRLNSKARARRPRSTRDALGVTRFDPSNHMAMRPMSISAAGSPYRWTAPDWSSDDHKSACPSPRTMA
eukprot:4473777-Pyramimonas_sp.AAC.1